jgi:hypothetical protein
MKKYAYNVEFYDPIWMDDNKFSDNYPTIRGLFLLFSDGDNRLQKYQNLLGTDFPQVTFQQ